MNIKTTSSTSTSSTSTSFTKKTRRTSNRLQHRTTHNHTNNNPFEDTHDQYRNKNGGGSEEDITNRAAAADQMLEEGLPYPEVAGSNTRTTTRRASTNSSTHNSTITSKSNDSSSLSACISHNSNNSRSSNTTSSSNNTSHHDYDHDDSVMDDGNSSSLPYPEAAISKRPFTIDKTTSSVYSPNDSTNTTNNTDTTTPSLPYQDAGLPVRKPKENDVSKRKAKSRVKLGSKLKGRLSKLRKKRDSKYHQILIEDDEESGNKNSGTDTAASSSQTISSLSKQSEPSSESTSIRRKEKKKKNREAESLTTNGNSLPNLGPSRKRENAFSAMKRLYCGQDIDNDDMSSNYVCYLLIFFFLLSLALILVGESHGVASPLHFHQQRPTFPPEPTQPPEMIHDHGNDPSGHGDFTIHQWQVHQNLALISSKDIDTPTTPQYKAAQWMFYVDEMGYGAESPFLFQRFLLAIFYYMMDDGYQCFKLMAGVDECDWDRVTCDEKGVVEEILFENCRINGEIPVEMPWGFEKIKTIDLSGNNLIGNIPAELELLTNLESLYLERNEKLEGEVPDLLCRNKDKGSLINFTVQCSGESSKVDCSCCDHCNGKSHGGIPIGGQNGHNIDVELNERQQSVLSKLKTISGNLVHELGTPQNQAAYWIIKFDKGQYPAESEFLYQRYVLSLLHFMIEGSSMLLLEQKTRLDECNWDGIACNANGHVIGIRFDGMGVTGHIPMELKVLHDLTYLDMSSNKLTGDIPTGLSLLDKLETLLLENNNLEGPVPEQICSRHDSGLLVHIKTDCEAGGPVQCRCCENCSKVVAWDTNQKATWNKIAALSGDKVDDRGTPQYKAAHWILDDDKWHYPSTSPFVYQRYVLILLYQMMGDDSWFSPNPHTDECKWSRVGCNHAGYVEHIELDGCDMTGTIPVELKMLEDLKYLDLSSNKLSGQVPSELSELSKLETILLDSNNINGNIPDSLCELHDSGVLQTLKVDCGRGLIVECKCCECSSDNGSGEAATTEWDYNQKATWSVLSTLSDSAVLEDQSSPQYKAAHFILDEDKWHYLSSSSFLYQRYVLLIMYYMMGDNSLFTPDAGKDECKWERVGCNHEGYVEHIKFDDCDMTGKIPKEIEIFHDLKYLDLSHNNLSGIIPSELGLLMSLETLMLDSNSFYGAVPDAVCTRHNTGLLTQISTDCKANDSKVQCSCCFNCPDSKESSTHVCAKNKMMALNGDEGSARAQKIQNKCLQISGSSLCQHNSPQNLAMRWLIEDDRQNLDADSPGFVQRYVMTIIYFSLGPNEWVDSFWLSKNQDECEITGVSCDQSGTHILSLNFTDSGMEGVLPPEISELEHLVEIDFSDNEIDGEVPPSWSKLNNLKSLNLSYNDMTGMIPQSICNLKSDGNLVAVLVDCGDVKCTCCDGCAGSIDGSSNNNDEPIDDLRIQQIGVKVHSISTDLNVEPAARSKALQWIIRDDDLQITADSEFFTQRYVLAVFYFALDGQNWTLDTAPWLSSDSFCSWHGVMCDTNGDVDALVLPSLGLKGQLPYELSNLNKLRVMKLSRNNITGSIPDEFVALSNLSILYLHSNDMDGHLGNNQGVCSLRKDKLQDLWLDCDKLNCPATCCTKCGLLGTKPIYRRNR